MNITIIFSLSSFLTLSSALKNKTDTIHINNYVDVICQLFGKRLNTFLYSWKYTIKFIDLIYDQGCL